MGRRLSGSIASPAKKPGTSVPACVRVEDDMRSAICAAFVLATVTVLPASADDVLLVSPKVMEFYNGTYQGLKPPRAIAVSADGRHLGYSYCPEHRCYMTPSARALAMQACVKAGGQGCRIFAIDDDIEANYRVMDLSDLLLPAAGTVAPKTPPAAAQPCAGKTPEQCQPSGGTVVAKAPPAATQPCVGKTPQQCQTIADFAARRKQIEDKWAKTIAEQRRYACASGTEGRPCMVAKQSEADRDAELSALDTELRRQLME
jgi:hypothetical protein